MTFKDYKAHGGVNSNKEKLIRNMPNIRSCLAEYFNCREEKIYFKGDGTKVKKIKAAFGEVNSKFKGLSNLLVVIGKADFVDSEVIDLSSLESIGGYADFRYSQVTNLRNLKNIGENAYFSNSEVTDLSNLESIGGDADFSDSKVTKIPNLRRIGGTADFSNSLITDFGKLEFIGDVKFSKKDKILKEKLFKEFKKTDRGYERIFVKETQNEMGI